MLRRVQLSVDASTSFMSPFGEKYAQLSYSHVYPEDIKHSSKPRSYCSLLRSGVGSNYVHVACWYKMSPSKTRYWLNGKGFA